MKIVGRIHGGGVFGYQAEVLAITDTEEFHIAGRSSWSEKKLESWVDDTVDFWVNHYEHPPTTTYVYTYAVEVTRP